VILRDSRSEFFSAKQWISLLSPWAVSPTRTSQPKSYRLSPTSETRSRIVPRPWRSWPASPPYSPSSSPPRSGAFAAAASPPPPRDSSTRTPTTAAAGSACSGARCAPCRSSARASHAPSLQATRTPRPTASPHARSTGSASASSALHR
jgi:hypothetical protein